MLALTALPVQTWTTRLGAAGVNEVARREAVRSLSPFTRKQ